MDEGAPRRRWWRKKRWIAAAIFALALPGIFYPASRGLVNYCRGWGLVSDESNVADLAYLPLEFALEAAFEVPVLKGSVIWFEDWEWKLMELGEWHGARRPAPPAWLVDGPVYHGEFVGIDFDFNAQDTARPASGPD